MGLDSDVEHREWLVFHIFGMVTAYGHISAKVFEKNSFEFSIGIK
jgi:hypothetical protein